MAGTRCAKHVPATDSARLAPKQRFFYAELYFVAELAVSNSKVKYIGDRDGQGVCDSTVGTKGIVQRSPTASYVVT